MKRKLSSMRSFLLGVLTTLLVVGMAVPALAATVTKSIEVRSGIRVFIDDQELIPKDAKGNPVEVFLYNGTTYLPARAISEAVGKPIQWDGSVQGVYIGKHSSSKPTAYLGQKDYFTKVGNFESDVLTKDNLGNEHTHSIQPKYHARGSQSITYRLNGQYNRLTASYYMLYEYRDKDNDKSCTLAISADGRQIWQGSVSAGKDPINIDIDLAGALELTIEYPEGSDLGSFLTALGDVALWS